MFSKFRTQNILKHENMMQRIRLADIISTQTSMIIELQREYNDTYSVQTSDIMLENIKNATEALRNLVEVYDVLR